MKVELPRYANNRPSGILWLGNVPVHWEVKALKRETPVLRGASPRPIDNPIYFDECGEYSWVRISDVTAAGTYLDETEQKLSELGSSLSVKMNPGALFLSIAGSVGKPCITRIKCCIHDGFVFFPRFKGNTKFLFYIFASGEPYRGLGKLGTQLNLNTDTVASIVMGFPPLCEQDAIVTFLNRETAKIDRLMAVRQNQVERLQEQRTAVIHHAVTKGLDPHARMKPSGVDWLGDVPEGWMVKRLKFWVKHISAQVSVMPDGHAYLALEHVEGKTGRILPNESAEFDSNVKLFKANDILFGRLRPYLAKVALPDFDGVCVGELMVLRVDQQEVSPRYLQLRLLTPDFIDLVDGSTQGAKMPRANWSFVGDIKVALPPRSDQDAVVTHIDRETAKLDTLMAKYRRELDLLAEYRASLISHAVTGKIDVRGLVEPIQ